jgi:flagellar hook-associated protein 2
VAGTYSLAVQNLATSAVLTSAPVDDSTSTAIGTGTLNIAVGSSSASITIDSTNDTLSGIADAINGAADNPGVTASIITTKDGARLVLSGTTTGAANAITTTETDGGTGLSSLVYDPSNSGVTNLTDTTPAADANFTLNGYAATSSSNVVTTALTGVSINLLKASATTTSTTTPAVTTSTPTTLTIAPNTANAATSIGTFVTALNGVLTAVQTLTGYDATTQTAGALNGNATLQSFQNQLENILDTVTTSGSGAHSLSDLGYLEDATSGTYTSNSTTLTNALTSNLASVQKLLGGPTGIATQINNLIQGYTGTGGLLTSVTQGLQTGLKTAATQQTALTAQLAIYSATLTTQYNAMDTAVAALKQTETYLTAEFNANATSSSTSSLSSGTTST